jgi:hypothetical protein
MVSRNVEETVLDSEFALRLIADEGDPGTGPAVLAQLVVES